MKRFELGTLILTPVMDYLPKEEILARYSNLYVLFANRDEEDNVTTINIGRPHERAYDAIGSNCWGLEHYSIVKYFEPVKDGKVEYSSDKPIFRITTTNEMTVLGSTTLAGDISLEDYMKKISHIKRAKLVAQAKTIVPITKEEKEIYDIERWETITLSDRKGIVDFATSENDPNSCYFGVVGEERINLFKQRDPNRPIIRLYISNGEVIASSPVHNCNSINEVISGRYGFNKDEFLLEPVKKLG